MQICICMFPQNNSPGRVVNSRYELGFSSTTHVYCIYASVVIWLHCPQWDVMVSVWPGKTGVSSDGVFILAIMRPWQFSRLSFATSLELCCYVFCWNQLGFLFIWIPHIHCSMAKIIVFLYVVNPHFCWNHANKAMEPNNEHCSSWWKIIYRFQRP